MKYDYFFFSFFGSQLPVNGFPQITTQVTIFYVQYQLTNICSKSTIESLKKCEVCSKVTTSTPEPLFVLVSVLFILNMSILFRVLLLLFALKM